MSNLTELKSCQTSAQITPRTTQQPQGGGRDGKGARGGNRKDAAGEGKRVGR